MKNLLFSILIMSLPLTGFAAKTSFLLGNSIEPGAIPSKFMSSSDTSVLEWGCPVSDLIRARSKAEALQIVGKECVEEARRAAAKRPGVFEVINASVVWPDVTISEESNGYRLQGTFFLETLVLEAAGGFTR